MALIQFNAKIQPDTLDLFNRLMEESESKTKGMFIDELLESFQNPRKASSNEEDKNLIQEQKELIERLTNRSLELEEKNVEFEGALIDLKAEYKKLYEDNDQLTVQLGNKELTKDQVLITLEPHVKFFVDAILSEYQKRNKPTTAGEMLKNLFWNYIYRGPGDYLPVVYSTNYIKQILENFKRIQQQKEAAANGAQ